MRGSNLHEPCPHLHTLSSLTTVQQADKGAPAGDVLEGAVAGEVTEGEAAGVAQGREQPSRMEVDDAVETAVAEEELTPEAVEETPLGGTGMDEADASAAALTPEPPVIAVSAKEDSEKIVGDLPFATEQDESATAPTGYNAAESEEKGATTEEAVGAEKAPAPVGPVAAFAVELETSSPSAVNDAASVPGLDGRLPSSSTVGEEEVVKAPAADIVEEACGLLEGAAAAAAATGKSEPTLAIEREVPEVEGGQQAEAAAEEAVIEHVIEVSLTKPNLCRWRWCFFLLCELR